MSKKYLLISIAAIILIFGGIMGYVLYIGKGGTPNGPGTTNPGFQPSFGTSSQVTPGISTTTQATSSDPQGIAPRIPALRQISSTPVAGAIATSTATTTYIWYMDRGVGHVYQTQVDSNEKKLLSNTTLPRVYNTVWASNSRIIAQYDKEGDGSIVNFYGEVAPVNIGTSTDKSPYVTRGYSIPGEIIDLALSPKNDKLFSLIKEENQTAGYISSLDGSKRVLVWTNPLSEWVTSWPEENIITLTTKATSMGPGYMYALNLKTGVITKKLGGIRGLTSLTNTTATKILFTSVNASGIVMRIGNFTDNTARDAVIKTLPEKCVWSKLNPEDAYCAVPTNITGTNHPDAWYQGALSFTDQIWHINTTTGEVHILANLLDISGKIIDVTKPMLDKNEEYLIFTNKRDLSLWSLDLTTNN